MLILNWCFHYQVLLMWRIHYFRSSIIHRNCIWHESADQIVKDKFKPTVETVTQKNGHPPSALLMFKMIKFILYFRTSLKITKDRRRKLYLKSTDEHNLNCADFCEIHKPSQMSETLPDSGLCIGWLERNKFIFFSTNRDSTAGYTVEVIHAYVPLIVILWNEVVISYCPYNILDAFSLLLGTKHF